MPVSDGRSESSAAVSHEMCRTKAPRRNVMSATVVILTIFFNKVSDKQHSQKPHQWPQTRSTQNSNLPPRSESCKQANGRFLGLSKCMDSVPQKAPKIPKLPKLRPRWSWSSLRLLKGRAGLCRKGRDGLHASRAPAFLRWSLS